MALSKATAIGALGLALSGAPALAQGGTFGGMSNLPSLGGPAQGEAPAERFARDEAGAPSLFRPGTFLHLVEGAGGVIGLGQLARQDDDALLMMMGLVMVGAVDTNDSDTRLDDITPIARLIGETELIVAAADAPFDDIQGFVDAWRADPAGTDPGLGLRVRM